MSDLSDPLEARRMYIAHLAAQLDAMDSGAAPVRAVAYRLFARRLVVSVAPTSPLSSSACPPIVCRALLTW